MNQTTRYVRAMCKKKQQQFPWKRFTTSKYDASFVQREKRTLLMGKRPKEFPNLRHTRSKEFRVVRL